MAQIQTWPPPLGHYALLGVLRVSAVNRCQWVNQIRPHQPQRRRDAEARRNRQIAKSQNGPNRPGHVSAVNVGVTFNRRGAEIAEAEKSTNRQIAKWPKSTRHVCGKRRVTFNRQAIQSRRGPHSLGVLRVSAVNAGVTFNRRGAEIAEAEKSPNRQIAKCQMAQMTAIAGPSLGPLGSFQGCVDFSRWGTVAGGQAGQGIAAGEPVAFGQLIEFRQESAVSR